MINLPFTCHQLGIGIFLFFYALFIAGLVQGIITDFAPMIVMPVAGILVTSIVVWIWYEIPLSAFVNRHIRCKCGK